MSEIGDRSSARNRRLWLYASVASFVSLTGIAAPAFAQDDDSPAPAATDSDAAASQAPDDSFGGEIVVTGSRVILEGLSSPTPVTALSSDELLQSQPRALVDALSEVPSLSSTQTAKSIGSGGGAFQGPGSYLNLRNLGASRNLVLLDGQRLTPTNVVGNVDINLLPQSLVQSVNIVTGGASAAYGSDAVAGVVDFRLDTRLTGLKVALTGGIADAGDGEYYKISLAGGVRLLDDRLHLIGSFDMIKNYHAYAGNRDWSSAHCAVIPIPGVTTANQSATNPRQTIACDARLPYASFGGAITSGALVTNDQGIDFGPGGTVQPFVYGSQRTTSYMVGGSGVPLNDDYDFSPEQRNTVAFGRAGYDVTDDIEAFVQFTYARTTAEFPYTAPNFFTPRPLTIYSGNAFLPAEIQTQMTQKNVASFQLGIVPVDWGTMNVISEIDHYDFISGLKGDFGSGWRWDVSYEHGHTAYDSMLANNIIKSNFFRAVDAVKDPVTGNIVCRATLTNPSTAAGCVPINVFGPGSASPEALDYVQGDLTNGNRVTQDHVQASLRGEPFSLFAGPVSFAVGAEWRRLVGNAYTDALSETQQVDFTGIRGVPTSVSSQPGGWMTLNPLGGGGTQTVKEAFGEVLIPVLRDEAWTNSLDLNAAVRVTDYSTSGTVVTWKVGATWEPATDFLFRATQSHDIRAPSIYELYSGGNSSNGTVTDPTKGGQTFNIRQLSGGNPDLKPERADTFTGGLTYQPSWLPGVGVSVDYYDIKIKDVLGSLRTQDIVDRCFAGAIELCALITRDDAGVISTIRTYQLNLSAARTRGVDFEINYRSPLSAFVSSWSGNASLRVIGTRLIEQSSTTPTLTGFNYVDRVGDIGSSNPKWRFNATFALDTGAFGFDISGRYIGAGKLNTNYVVGDIDDNDIAAVFTLDASVRYTLESLPGEPQFFVNVSNLLDKDPPMVPQATFYQAPTNAGLYDTMGRFFSAGVKARF